jgi:hypothetical protein
MLVRVNVHGLHRYLIAAAGLALSHLQLYWTRD